MSNILNIYVRCSSCGQVLQKSLTVILYKPRGQPEIRVEPCKYCLDGAAQMARRERADEE